VALLSSRPLGSTTGANVPEQEPVQLPLPLPRGSLDYVSFAAHYQRPYGWVLRTWHRHSGDLQVCERKDLYESLTTTEMQDVVCAVMGSANSQWYMRGGICVPQDETPASSVPDSQ
jgi:hypothetical protein